MHIFIHPEDGAAAGVDGHSVAHEVLRHHEHAAAAGPAEELVRGEEHRVDCIRITLLQEELGPCLRHVECKDDFVATFPLHYH